MDRNNRIISICVDIERFFRDYEIILSEGIPQEDDVTRFHAISMVLFTILNLSFEAGEEVIGSIHAGLPQSYRDIFRILHEEKIIDGEIRDKMSRMVYYRNRLAHQYVGLNHEDIVSIISNLDAVKEFISCMKTAFR